MENVKEQNTTQELSPHQWDAQFAQAMEMYRSNNTLTIQVLTVLVVADVTLLGFAFERQSAIILFLTGFLPISGAIAFHRMAFYMKPVMYSSLHLERRFRLPSGDLLATSLFGMQLSNDVLTQIYDIGDEQDFDTRMQRLARLRLGNDRRAVHGVGRGLIITAAVLQFLGAIVLGWLAGWTWFG